MRQDGASSNWAVGLASTIYVHKYDFVGTTFGNWGITVFQQSSKQKVRSIFEGLKPTTYHGGRGATPSAVGAPNSISLRMAARDGDHVALPRNICNGA